jgi:hypothetical protein
MAYDPAPSQWPTIRAVVSGDVITFSIEVDYDRFDSYRLSGEYRSPFFPSPTPEQRAALIERIQYGAVKLRSTSCPSQATLDRAAAYGADILRRRGESLVGPEILRKERLGDNNHLVLFVRNSRNGQTSSLGIASAGQRGMVVIQNVRNGQGVQAEQVELPALPACGLASPKIAPGGPTTSYPLFVGGEEGSRLVEVWLIGKEPFRERFRTPSPTPLFDVEYLFLRPQ